jgi:hypothetical protein
MSCAVLGNDVFIFNILNKSPGFFVEAGCGDGSGPSNSNSLYLEERGWKGIGIDINNIDAFNKNRKSIGIQADLKVRGIEDILEENNAPEIIDFFSFDVDEAQKSALDFLKLNKFKFKHIHFEHNNFITPDDPNYIPLNIKHLKTEGYKKFTEAGYVRVVEDVLDSRGLAIEDWYVHKDFISPDIKYLKNILYSDILKEYNFIA